MVGVHGCNWFIKLVNAKRESSQLYLQNPCNPVLQPADQGLLHKIGLKAFKNTSASDLENEFSMT